MRILIVDDEADIRRILRILLEKAKYEVIEAQDGVSAIECIRNDRSIDLCIMDVMMPNMNGMAKTALSSFVIALMAGLSVIIGIGTDGGTIIIGSIMSLVPGLSFGTAMRDLLCGDLASGSLRTLQAVLQALMIAFGYLLAFVIVGGGVI